MTFATKLCKHYIDFMISKQYMCAYLFHISIHARVCIYLYRVSRDPDASPCGRSWPIVIIVLLLSMPSRRPPRPRRRWPPRLAAAAASRSAVTGPKAPCPQRRLLFVLSRDAMCMPGGTWVSAGLPHPGQPRSGLGQGRAAPIPGNPVRASPGKEVPVCHHSGANLPFFATQYACSHSVNHFF